MIQDEMMIRFVKDSNRKAEISRKILEALPQCLASRSPQKNTLKQPSGRDGSCFSRSKGQWVPVSAG